MSIAVYAGHSQATEGSRHYEWERCAAAAYTLIDLCARARFDPIPLPPDIYTADNNTALRRKVQHTNDHRATLAVELHLNAGGGNYSTAIYWDNGEGVASGAGERLAAAICKQFQSLPWRTVGAQPQSYFNRSLYFLNETNCPAVIVEIGFKDNPEHLAYIDPPSGAVDYAARVYAGIADTLRD